MESEDKIEALWKREKVAIEKPGGADRINPDYYKLDLPCESIEYQLAVCKRVPGDEAPLVFNVLKYTTRYKLKNGIEDIKKAIWYANKLLEVLEKKL